MFLLAQQFGPNAGGGNTNAAANAGALAFAGGFLICMLIVLGIAILIQVFFCLNLSKLLKNIKPRNREVEPGGVWLLFIPFFNLYWIFALTGRIADSLANEFDDRRWRPDGDFGRTIGMWYGITAIASCVPYLGMIAGVASLVLWIMYWVKTAGWRNKLERGNSRDDDFDDRRDDRGRDDEYDDRRDEEEDDRPRRRDRDDDDR